MAQKNIGHTSTTFFKSADQYAREDKQRTKNI